MSEQGTHFINNTIHAMTEEFEVHHQKSTPFHPQENGTGQQNYGERTDKDL